MNGQEEKQVAGDAAGTPSSRWASNGEPDPHGRVYDCERAALAHGGMTDDELANAVFLEPSMGHLMAAKDRIRWLSRRLLAALPAQPAEWQPIETAPVADFVTTHPVDCLVWSSQIGGVLCGRAWRYDDGEAVGQANGYNGEWQITHWRPLPEPPAP